MTVPFASALVELVHIVKDGIASPVGVAYFQYLTPPILMVTMVSNVIKQLIHKHKHIHTTCSLPFSGICFRAVTQLHQGVKQDFLLGAPPPPHPPH